jgi:hypothetical protein
MNKSVKQTGAFTRLLFAAALAVPVFFMSTSSSDDSNTQCTPSLANANACIMEHNANNNWFAWISGSSRSTQFQFIDLFELLHGDEDKSNKAVIHTREG